MFAEDVDLVIKWLMLVSKKKKKMNKIQLLNWKNVLHFFLGLTDWTKINQMWLITLIVTQLFPYISSQIRSSME